MFARGTLLFDLCLEIDLNQLTKQLFYCCLFISTNPKITPKISSILFEKNKKNKKYGYQKSVKLFGIQHEILLVTSIEFDALFGHKKNVDQINMWPLLLILYCCDQVTSFFFLFLFFSFNFFIRKTGSIQMLKR